MADVRNEELVGIWHHGGEFGSAWSYDIEDRGGEFWFIEFGNPAPISKVGKNQFQAFVRESRATFTVCMHKTDPFGFEKCQDSKVAPKPFEVIPGASACTAKKDKVSESGSG